MSHVANCVCGQGWRFESVDIKTGQLKAVLHPISADWEEKHSQPGQGSLTVAPRDLSWDNIWPDSTAVYFSRIVDGEREGRWAGKIEQAEGNSNSGVTIGLQGIDEYLFHRSIADGEGGISYSTPGYVNESAPGAGLPQSQIARDLVLLAVQQEGIPLVPIAGDSVITRVRQYNSWDFKNIGEAVQDLVTSVDGVRYRLDHKYSNGFWRTEMVFADILGSDRGVVLRGGIKGAEYGVTVDAKDHATWVYAIGAGEEVNQRVAVAYDEANIYPRYHAVPAWKDVLLQPTLNSHAEGYVASYRDPLTTPYMILPGLDGNVPTPDQLRLGDLVFVDFEYGLVRYSDHANVLSIAWKLADGAPVTRTVNFQPEIRAYDSVRTLRGTSLPPPIAPAPPGGSVSNFKDPRITDSAGMTHSKTD